MTTTTTNPTTTTAARKPLLALASLGMLLCQQAQGHVMMAGSPFLGLARSDRALGRLTRMVDELVSDNNFLPPAALPLWRKVVQHQTTDMSQPTTATDTISAFRADAIETENSYIISADLPGVKRENIRIAFLADGVLAITAERQSLYEPVLAKKPASALAAQQQADNDKDKQKAAATTNPNDIQVTTGVAAATESESWPKHLMREVTYGKAFRKFKLPSDADQDSTTAAFENGVLVVTMKKRQAPKEKLVQIK